MEQNSASQGEKTISGCAVGCIATAVLVPLILILGVYYTIMHSTVPLKMVAGLVDSAPGVTINGIGGSISSGFTIDELRVADDDGHESVMEGLVLKWKDITKLRKSNQLIIEEITLDKAHFFFDSNESAEEEGEESDPSEDEFDSGIDDGDGFDLRRFEIRKVDIREVVFESKNSDFKVEIDEIFLKGLRIEDDDFALEDLSVGSNFIDLQLEDATEVEISGAKVPFTRRIRGVVKSIIHPSVIKDIDFSVELGASGGEVVTRILAFDGAVEGHNPVPGVEGFATLKNFSSTEYFLPELFSIPDELSISMHSKPGAGEGPVAKVEGGSFKIGKAEFDIPAQELQEDDSPIKATGKFAGLDLTVMFSNVDEGIGVRVDLESQPNHSPRELMATLLFEQAYETLDAAAKAKVDTSLNRYHFPKAKEQ